MLKVEVFHDYIWPFAYNAAVWLDKVRKDGFDLTIKWKSFVLDANKDGVDQDRFWILPPEQQGRSIFAHKIAKAAIRQGEELFDTFNLNIYPFKILTIRKIKLTQFL